MRSPVRIWLSAPKEQLPSGAAALFVLTVPFPQRCRSALPGPLRIKFSDLGNGNSTFVFGGGVFCCRKHGDLRNEHRHASGAEGRRNEQASGVNPGRGQDCPGETQREHFNPLAPYVARRYDHPWPGGGGKFQSTRPMRGETLWTPVRICPAQFQSTRPVRGETRALGILQREPGISIHSPRTGRDTSDWLIPRLRELFQSTRPAKSTLWSSCDFNPLAPYGARPACSTSSTWTSHFNPLAPYGARPYRTMNPLQL